MTSFVQLIHKVLFAVCDIRRPEIEFWCVWSTTVCIVNGFPVTGCLKQQANTLQDLGKCVVQLGEGHERIII